MASPSDIGWVIPAMPIRGLDHLGVQAPCEALYAQLLPGITNVTDRARYYSFYPWLLRSFELRSHDHSIDKFRHFLRRAECLFALIAIRHARVAGDHNDALHGLGMVGRLALLRIPPDVKSFELEDYAGLEAPHRYFQNKMGGLGQYYFGPLRDLRILDHVTDGDSTLPGYDKLRGSLLADAFGAAVPENAFFKLIEKGQIRWTDLDGLCDFCPCALHKSEVERNLLLDLFFARSAPHKSSEADNRRSSLALILDLLCRTSPIPGYSIENVFRAAAYTGYLPDQTEWTVPPPLAAAQRGWRTYECNEMFSLSLQALFAVTLASIEHRHRGRLRSVADAADVCADLLPQTGRKDLLADAVSELKSNLPPLEAWQDERHEIQRGWRILETTVDTNNLSALLNECTQVLLSLLARGIDANPYSEFDFDPDYFAAQELHLVSFRREWDSTWAEMTVEQWVRWLAVHWGIQRHLSVALRKLRGEHRDTFRIRPLEQELRVVEIPSPAQTIPRLGKAFQILRDLDLTTPDNDGWPHLTSTGRVELEAHLA